MAGDSAHLKNWQFHIDLEKIAWAVIDVPGQSQNTLGRGAIEELDALLTAVADGARANAIRGMVVISGQSTATTASTFLYPTPPP